MSPQPAELWSCGEITPNFHLALAYDTENRQRLKLDGINNPATLACDN